jgi:hypothetical protein
MIDTGEQGRADWQEQMPAPKAAHCCSGFHEIRTMPPTTKKVPTMTSAEACSPRIVTAIAALISGPTACSALLREAPIFSTPVYASRRTPS